MSGGNLVHNVKMSYNLCTSYKSVNPLVRADVMLLNIIYSWWYDKSCFFHRSFLILLVLNSFHNVRTFLFTFKQYFILKRVCIFHKQSFYDFIVNFISTVLFSHCGVATGWLFDHIFVSITNNKCIKYIELIVISKLAITCSKLTKETLGQGMKYVQS